MFTVNVDIQILVTNNEGKKSWRPLVDFNCPYECVPLVYDHAAMRERESIERGDPPIPTRITTGDYIESSAIVDAAGVAAELTENW